FLYGSGARYVKSLKDKGGWASVNIRYKFPPRTTASILSPSISAIDLGPGKSVGAFGLIQTFGEHAEAKALALAAATGLIGDRIVEDGAVKSWQLAFDTADHAERFARAYDLHGRADKTRVAGASVRGSRVVVVEAPNASAHRAAIDRMEGAPALQIYSAK